MVSPQKPFLCVCLCEISHEPQVNTPQPTSQVVTNAVKQSPLALACDKATPFIFPDAVNRWKLAVALPALSARLALLSVPVRDPVSTLSEVHMSGH